MASLPVKLIRACYAATPGNEIESGKFASAESSAALVADAFGFFLDRAQDLPAFPATDGDARKTAGPSATLATRITPSPECPSPAIPDGASPRAAKPGSDCQWIRRYAATTEL
jgi:hypothetical protein